MKFGSKVKIRDLNAVGRVVAIIISEYGRRYEVRYFWEGSAHQEMFFKDEIEEIK